MGFLAISSKFYPGHLVLKRKKKMGKKEKVSWNKFVRHNLVARLYADPHRNFWCLKDIPKREIW